MKLIMLTQDYATQVDDADYEWLNKYDWRIYKKRTWLAAIMHENDLTIYMHRLITNAPNGVEVDHIDRNSLNNQRYNLRLASRQQNARNSKGKSNPMASRYKGVWWDKHSDRWVATINIGNKKRIRLGYFTDEILAALTYNAAARDIFGEFAYLNTFEDFLNIP
jgi:hypothetical protein